MSPPMYRDPSSGYWGFPSSTMDWCEENYAVTSYVAEFCKSIVLFLYHLLCFFFNIEAVLQWLVYVPLCSRSPVRFLLISYLVGQNFIVTSKNLSHFCPKKRDSR